MAAPPVTPNHDELVEVFDTQQESEAMVVKGLLESEGIAVMERALDAPQDVLPGVGGVTLLVNPENRERAIELIEEHLRSGAIDEDTELPPSTDAAQS